MPSEPNSDRESTKDVDPYLNRSLLSKAIWSNVFLCTVGHVASLYGFYLCFTTAKWQTLVWSLFLMAYGGFGITGGAHRLWSHSSYKAKWPLRVLAAVGQTLALQHDIYQWCWNHRMHHKYSETDADPFNAKRGFFYSHIGWMLCEEHPEIKRRRNAILMNDLQADPIVAYQRRFYVPLAALFGVALPIIAPCLWWNETRRASFFVAFVLRYILSLNVTGMVNSVAHAAYWGFRPYDKSINSSENRIVAVLTIGEGWHNYHHVFPWDYKAAELGDYSTNWTTALIDWFAEIGWAYDRKTVPETLIRSRAQRTGDGTRFECFEDTILDSTPIQSTN